MIHPKIDQQITFLYTDDLKKSANFYEKIMGFILWLDQGNCRIYSLNKAALIGICQVNDESKGKFETGEQNNIIFTIVTEAVDEWYDYLVENGIIFEKLPQTNPNSSDRTLNK